MRIPVTLTIMFLIGGLALAQTPPSSSGSLTNAPERQGRAADRQGVSRELDFSQTFSSHPAGSELFYVTVITVQPGVTLPMHTHSGPKYQYVISGEVQDTNPGAEPTTLKSGQGKYVPQGTAHELKNAGNQPAQLIVFIVGEPGKPITAVSK